MAHRASRKCFEQNYNRVPFFKYVPDSKESFSYVVFKYVLPLTECKMDSLDRVKMFSDEDPDYSPEKECPK